MDKFGVGTFGVGQIGGKTMYFALRELEQDLKSKETIVETITHAADKIGTHVHDLLKQHTPDLDKLPDEAVALGFQVVGYDKGLPTTVDINIGKKVKKRTSAELGATVSGEQQVVQALWALAEQSPQDQANFQFFSLQDAIDYAEFLIRTTVDHHKFSQRLPTVGGEIDIALVTPFDDYRWIKRKPLTEIIDRRIP